MRIHPYAEIFPVLEGAEFDALCADIKANGQIEPIKLLHGQIIDGRNRFNACKAIGVVPKYKDVFPTDALQYVLSLNLSRRHLDESQRAMVAAKIANLKRGDNQHAPIGATSQSKAAEMLNVSRRSVQRAAEVTEKGTEELQKKVQGGALPVSTAVEIATLPHEEQQALLDNFDNRQILAKAKEIRQQKQIETRTKKVESITAEFQTNGCRYSIIYADPAWRYDYAETENRAIENHYGTLSLEEICDLPVSKIVAEDSVLFLWATSPKLEEAFAVIKAWGFNYRTCAVWDKQKIGMGYYFRQRHEILLVASKGNLPVPLPENRHASVVVAPRGKHSEKPIEFYEIIESMYPELPKIELFARSKREHWESWGNEVNKPSENAAQSGA